MKKVMIIGMLTLLAAGCTREEAPPSSETPVATDAQPVKPPAPNEPTPTPAVTVTPAQVFGWRRDGTGRFENVTAPTRWDSDDGTGILWRTRVGASFSSPVIVRDRVFVTSEQDQLACVDAKDGKILWDKDNGFDSLPAEIKVEEKRYPSSCGFSTPTPVTDGKTVYASYGSGIVVACDLEGNRKWVRYFDRPPSTEYGRAASPVLVHGRLLVSIGHLTALDPVSGRTLWEAKEAVSTYYGTPVAATIGDVTVVITPAGDCVRVADGTILAKAIAGTQYNSPVIRDDVIYFADVTSTALKLPEKPGETLECKPLWEVDLEGEFFSSPVWHDDILYVVCNEGVLYALDAATGKTVWKKTLEIPSAGGMAAMAPANLYPSLALAGGKLFLSNDTGTMLVLEPGRVYKEVSKNLLDEGSGAGPVFAGTRLYLRGGEELYCIGSE